MFPSQKFNTFTAPSRNVPSMPDDVALVGGEPFGLLAVLRGTIGDRRMRPLQRAVHRRSGGAEHVGHLSRSERQHFAQDQDRPLVGRQMLKRGDIGQLDALPHGERRLRVVPVSPRRGDAFWPGAEPVSFV